MPKDISKQDLLDYLNKKCGTSLNEDANLFDDLQIAGLDVAMLMEQFSVDFEVDLQAFDFTRYATPEAELNNTFLIFYRFLFRREKLVKATFTIYHLLEVIRKGVWFDPPVNASLRKDGIKANFYKSVIGMEPMYFINTLPAIAPLILAFVGNKIDSLALFLFGLISAVLLLLGFSFFPFYLNGRVSVTSKALVLVKRNKETILDWDDIEGFNMKVIETGKFSEDHISIIVLLRNKETREFRLMRHLLKNKYKMLHLFLAQMMLIPIAKTKLQPEIIKDFEAYDSRLNKRKSA